MAYSKLVEKPGRFLVMCLQTRLMGLSSSLHILSDHGEACACHSAELSTLDWSATSLHRGEADLRMMVLHTLLSMALVRIVYERLFIVKKHN